MRGARQGRQQRRGLVRRSASCWRSLDAAQPRSLADLRRARPDRDRAQLRGQADRQAAAAGARGPAAARRRAQLAQLPLRPRDLLVRGGDGDDPGRRRSAPSPSLLAFALALGRPYLGMHYPSDVLAGALLGVVLGLIVPLSL